MWREWKGTPAADNWRADVATRSERFSTWGYSSTEPQTLRPHYSPPGPPRCSAADCEGGESLRQTLLCASRSPIESWLKGSLPAQPDTCRCVATDNRLFKFLEQLLVTAHWFIMFPCVIRKKIIAVISEYKELLISDLCFKRRRFLGFKWTPHWTVLLLLLFVLVQVIKLVKLHCYGTRQKQFLVPSC